MSSKEIKKKKKYTKKNIFIGLKKCVKDKEYKRLVNMHNKPGKIKKENENRICIKKKKKIQKEEGREV